MLNISREREHFLSLKKISFLEEEAKDH